MQQYAIRRTLQAIPLLLGITLLSFLIIQAAPGDPAQILINPEASAEDVARIRTALGLDKPVYVQYWRWLTSMLRGDMGRSFLDGEEVFRKIANRLPNTLKLTGCALLFALIIAVPLGIICATKQYSILDYLSTVFAFIWVSMPSFWFALMLILVFCVWLRWLPSHGMRTYGAPFSLVDQLRHLILPMLALGLRQLAGLTRYTRSSMLEVVRQDYIRTARAKGLHERVVIYKHALRNALIPVITILGLSLPGLFGGAVVVENVFAWPGMGRLAVQAAFTRDYPVTMGVLVIAASMVVLGNLLADLAYGFVDPRIRYD